MYGDMGKSIVTLYWFAVISLFISTPLAVWKLIEILIYVYRHLHWD